MPPTMLIDTLQGLRRKMKVFSVVYGTGLVIACAVALLLAVVLLDWMLALPAPLRVVVNLAALGTLGYLMYHWVGREAAKKRPLSDLAGRLEEAFPHFEGTLRSTVEFIHPTRGEIPGSEVMKERTVVEAARRAQNVDLNKAMVLRPVWYSAAAGLGSLLLIAALVLLASHKFPDFLRIAANHLVGGVEPWPKSVEIDLIGNVPHRVAVGQHLDLKMRLKKGSASKAVVRYRFDNGPWQNQVIQRADDGTFSAGLDATADGAKDLSKMQIRLEAGDDQRDLNVDVVPRLDLKNVVALVKPPAYAELPPMPVNIAERPVVTVIGSEVDLKVTFNKQLDGSKNVHLDSADRARPAPKVNWTVNGDQAIGHFVANDQAFRPNDPYRFTLHATDQDGFENSGSQEFSVIVHDDALPTVQIEEPRQSQENTPNATIPLKVVAEDDFGIDVAQLVVNRLNKAAGPATRPAGPAATPPTTSPSAAPQQWVIDLHNKTVNADGASWTASESSTERKRFRLEFPWDLSKMANANFKPGDELEFFVQVKDNFSLPGIPQHPFVASPKLRVIIISHDQWDINVENILAQMKNEIGGIKRNQDLTHDENVNQSKETQERKKFDDAQRATVERLASQQSTAASQAKQASQKLQELLKKMTENKSPEKGTKETVDQVAKQLEQTSEGPMKQATSQLDQAKETKSDPKASAAQQKQNAQKATDSMDNAARNQEQASQELEQAMKKLENFGGLEPTIKKFEDLAKRQKELDEKYKKDLKDAIGKKPTDLSSDEKKKVEQESKDQDQLKKDTDEALNQMESKAEKMAKTDEKASKAMKSAAQTGKQQGIPQKQQQASQDMQQNQQSDAQNNQKQVELGLDMILEKLKEAQRHQLAELQAKLEELQQRVAELIMRQSGHNLDNLWLQDNSGKKITDLTEEVRKDLFDSSKRDPKAPFNTELAVLTPAQEQTQRTCRDVAEKAGSLPDPTAGTKLIAASTKMEQAIVYLRKTQLTDAYSPNQVDALALLKEAHKAIEEAKKKVEEQQRQEQEETIKQAYVKILEQQKKYDVETKDIDAAPKDEDGNLPRTLSARLRALPGEQGKLADQVNDLGKKLENLKSVVYVWANKDIATSMNEVKDDLAKPVTGVPTQAEQKRIEDQLQAMIDNLAKKQKPQPFAKRGGGGGGNGKPPPPRMPTDIELRLLKDLQIAVNRSTVKISAEKKKDAQKLLALGGREGELRGVLDQLLRKSTNDKVKLDKEPENKDLLPEETSNKDDIDNELVNNLLNDDASADDLTKKVKTLGDRFGRSRQRVAINQDPGKVTQDVQKHIVDQLDELIDLAQKQQQQASGKPKPGSKPGEQNGPPQPGQGQGPQEARNGQKNQNHNESGQSPAQAEGLTEGGDPQVDASHPLRDVGKENWGGLSPRERQAVMQGVGEKAFSKYDKFIKDYYRELAKKASER